MDCDILIVGAGIFGVSTAYHLSLSSSSPPSRIILLDRAPGPSTHAASTDVNKIVRADYSLPFYMDLAYEAIDAFTSWPLFQPQQSSNPPIYTRSGWAMMDEKGSDLASRIRETFRTSGREDLTYDMTEAEMRSNWGGLLSGMDVDGYDTAYGSPSAGWADASRAVEVMVNAAVEKGVKYEVGEVDEILLHNENEKGVQGVKLTDGRLIHARQVLLATGAWTSQLMTKLEDQLNIQEPDRIERQICAAAVCCAHFRFSPEEAEQYRKLPILVFGSEGEIIPPTKDHIYKFTDAGSLRNTITTPTGHQITCPPPSTPQSSVPPKLQREMNALISRRFPSLLSTHGPVDYWRLCWDSISPNQQQLITRHPDTKRLGNLYFAVGGSFHSWKFLPTIGKYVANVLRGMSNGDEKDRTWAWKSSDGSSKSERGAHEKVVPRRELREME